MEEREQFYTYIDRIQQIDHLLEPPAKSLIAIARRALDQPDERFASAVRLPLYFPPWVASDRQFPPGNLGVTSAICCATLQRLWRRRRRFPFLQPDLDGLAKRLRERTGRDVPAALAAVFLPARTDRRGYLRFLKVTQLLGRQRPWLACEMLWVLLNAGEGIAYSGSACLAFFGITWSLSRGPSRQRAMGAAIGSAPPTAYITARCLMPLLALTRTCRRRAELLEQIRGIVSGIDGLIANEIEAVRSRQLPFRLDELTRALEDYSELTLAAPHFRRCARQLELRAAAMRFDSPAGEEIWRQIQDLLCTALQGLGRMGLGVVGEVRPVIGRGGLLDKVCRALELRDRSALARLSVDFVGSNLVGEAEDEFWPEELAAARRALEICRFAYRALEETCRLCRGLKRGDGVAAIKLRLESMAEANQKVAAEIESSVTGAVGWCENAMLQEIAHASAGNATEFDPGELVSGLAVAVMTGSIASPRRLDDAVVKALKGAREDGSWAPGHPFATSDELDLGATAPSAGIVWMLSGAIMRHRAVQAADEALGRYVDWLEGTVRALAAQLPRQPPRLVSGWISERMVRPERIDLWATAFVVNSLINIRGLMEYRLWQVCERRFTVVSGGKTLNQLEAVDLGALHEHRLHSRLSQITRRVEGADFEDADYAVVLHGPPGSSKTAIAQALSREMWRNSRRVDAIEPRLIRITPADFTRGGEERLDYEARLIFDLLRHVRRVTVLFDEIDDLLRRRKLGERPSFISLVVPAMLNRLQDLRDACPRQEVFLVLATNYVDRIEPALIRRGRIDQAIPLVYPDRRSRLAILDERAGRIGKKLGDWASELFRQRCVDNGIDETDGWPYLTIHALYKDVVQEFSSLEERRKLSRPIQQQRDLAIFRQRLDQLLERHGASISQVDYSERLEKNPSCAELKDEFLSLLFSCADDLARYESVMRKAPVDLVSRGRSLWQAQDR